MRFAMPYMFVNPSALVFGELILVFLHEYGIGSTQLIARLHM